jgi:GntR family transcriptional repressor for pyruvate dehydrogenase complex
MTEGSAMKEPLSGVVPIKRGKVSDMAVEAIDNLIIRNNLKEGDGLPSEKSLSETLAVGTRSIREALKILEARGIVSVRHGKGAFVAGTSKENVVKYLADSLRMTLIADESLLFELVYVRMVIEASVASDVARSRTADDLARFSKILEALEKAHKEKSIEDYNRLDVVYHKAIIDASGNRILSALYDRMNSLLLASFSKTGYVRGSTKESIQEHRLLLDLIRKQDGKGAHALMIRHIKRSTESLKLHMKQIERSDRRQAAKSRGVSIK